MAANKDPDAVPRAILLDAIAAKIPTRTERRSLAVNLTPEQDLVIQNAARLRNMSLSAFMRRAALAFAAHDQGLEVEVVFENEQKIIPFDGNGLRRKYDADERDLGPWRITGLTR